MAYTMNSGSEILETLQVSRKIFLDNFDSQKQGKKNIDFINCPFELLAKWHNQSIKSGLMYMCISARPLKYNMNSTKCASAFG